MTNPPRCSPRDLRCHPMPVCSQGPSVATWASLFSPRGSSGRFCRANRGRTSSRGIRGKPFSSVYRTNTHFFKTPTHTAVPLVCAHCPVLCPACGTMLWALIQFLKPASPPLPDRKTVEGRGLLFLLFILNHSYYPRNTCGGHVITMRGARNKENASLSKETSVGGEKPL